MLKCINKYILNKNNEFVINCFLNILEIIFKKKIILFVVSVYIENSSVVHYNRDPILSEKVCVRQ